MTDLLFYKKLVALDKEMHRGHSIRKFDALHFAAHTQSVMLTGSEYAEACKEYPIVFVKAPDGSMMSVALLGFRQSENLYVDANGKWNARYIPGYVRRYPFVFSEVSAEQHVLCVDAECTGLNSAGEGEPLFDAQGTVSPFMNSMIQFLQDYQADFSRTRAFAAHLQELDLFTQNNVQITLNSGEAFLVNGIWMVDEARLAALDDATLLQFVRSGELGRIYAHLISLSNFNHFIKLEEQRAATA